MILIQNWNRIIIKNFPALWMSAIHIVFPVSIVIFGLGFFYGWSNPALDFRSWVELQFIFYFILGVVVLVIQYLRLINQIKFKMLLHFYFFCILGQAGIFLCIFSPNIAVIYNLSYNIDSLFMISFLFLYLSIITGIIFSAAIFREAIVSIIISAILNVILFFFLLSVFSNLELVYISVIILIISIAAIFWYMIKKIKFVDRKLRFYIYQINFLFFAVIFFAVFNLDNLYFEGMDFGLIYSLYPILLVPINIFFLKIYHKLYVLPKS